MPNRTRCKICGITNLDDALNAVEAGADALGFVFYAKSPRYIEPRVANEICRRLPPFVTKVGLFVDHSVDQVNEVLAQVCLDLLQFHGGETEVFCSRFSRPYIKAIRVRGSGDVYEAEQTFYSAVGLLVDTYRQGVPGGTGETFDWDLLPAQSRLPITLAGGLNPQNVRSAIAQVKPYAVDVSGGVEESKGKKDRKKVVRFLEEVMCEH